MSDCPDCRSLKAKLADQRITINACTDRFTDAEKQLKHVREQQSKLRIKSAQSESLHLAAIKRQGKLRQELTDYVAELDRERRIGARSWATLTTLCTNLAEGVRIGLPDGTEINESVGRWIEDLIKTEVDVVDLAYEKLRQELTDAKADIEHLRKRYSPFENDPFVVVAQAFAKLWPNAPFPRVQIVEGLHNTDDAKWAETLVLNDDGEILISIDVKAPMHGAVELLAHELAHVACEYLGLRSEDDHGPHWEECFAAIYEKFNAEAAKAAGEPKQ